MSRKRKFRQDSYDSNSCQCGKRIYTSKTWAKSAAKSKTEHDGVPWVAFKCPFWSTVWHIGHRWAEVPQGREEQREQVHRRQQRIERQGG